MAGDPGFGRVCLGGVVKGTPNLSVRYGRCQATCWSSERMTGARAQRGRVVQLKKGREFSSPGVVAEWFKAAVLKTAKGESPSRVRISPTPLDCPPLHRAWPDFRLRGCLLA